MQRPFRDPDPSSPVFTRAEAIRCVKDGVLTIPRHKTVLDYDFAYFVVRGDLPKVRTLVIPASVESIPTMRGDLSSGPYGYSDNPFSEIVVERKNPRFASKDGVLFTRDGSTLLCYPCGRPDAEYTLPKGVKTIREEAFLNVEHLERIRFPEGPVLLEENAFCACKNLDFPEIVTICRKESLCLLAVRDQGFYPKESQEEVDHYAFDLAVTDCCDASIHRMDRDGYDRFLESGALAVEDSAERLRLLRRFSDAVFWGGLDDELYASSSDIKRFVRTFYSDWE